MRESKRKSFPIKEVEEMLLDGRIRLDHPLQRESEQWSNPIKNGFITSMLRDDPVPDLIIAEQENKNGVPVKWLIDGKQRLTTAIAYRNNAFKIGRSLDRPIVTYIGKDEDGEFIRKEFNISNKFYRDLPEELQKEFDSYMFDFTHIFAVTDEDVEYHIRRYNQGKPMTASQKGITYLGEELAVETKKYKKHKFFLDNDGFKTNDGVNGAIERSITESIMSCFHLDDWKGSNDKICKYLKENSFVSEFDEFGEMLDQLYTVMDENISKLFNAKDSFLWLPVFNEFLGMGKDVKEFKNFVDDYVNGKVDKTRFLSVSERATKDRGVVTRRIAALTDIMNDYFTNDNDEDEPLPFEVNDMAC